MMNKFWVNQQMAVMLICILFGFQGFSFGQTKKESIKWINANGVSLSSISQGQTNYFSIVKVDKDSLFFINNGDEKVVGWDVKQSIALKDILYEDLSTLERRKNTDHYQLTNYAVKVRNITKEKTKNGRFKKVEDIVEFIFPFEDEHKANRVVSAIMNLARLSGAKENVQYY